MSENKTTITGKVTGLLRSCSPAIYVGGESIDLAVGSEVIIMNIYRGDSFGPYGVAKIAHTCPDPDVIETEGIWDVGVETLELNLEDPTGRSHATAWGLQHMNLTIEENSFLRSFCEMLESHPRNIRKLRDLCLKLDGRSRTAVREEEMSRGK